MGPAARPMEDKAPASRMPMAVMEADAIDRSFGLYAPALASTTAAAASKKLCSLTLSWLPAHNSSTCSYAGDKPKLAVC